MLYDLVLFLASFVLNIFFKEIKVRGIANIIPLATKKKQAVIFVVGKDLDGELK